MIARLLFFPSKCVFIISKTNATCIVKSFAIFGLSRWPLFLVETLWKCLGISVSVIGGLHVFLLGWNGKFNYMKKMQIAANCVNCERVALSSNINCQWNEEKTFWKLIWLLSGKVLKLNCWQMSSTHHWTIITSSFSLLNWHAKQHPNIHCTSVLDRLCISNSNQFNVQAVSVKASVWVRCLVVWDG